MLPHTLTFIVQFLTFLKWKLWTKFKFGRNPSCLNLTERVYFVLAYLFIFSVYYFYFIIIALLILFLQTNEWGTKWAGLSFTLTQQSEWRKRKKKKHPGLWSNRVAMVTQKTTLYSRGEQKSIPELVEPPVEDHTEFHCCQKTTGTWNRTAENGNKKYFTAIHSFLTFFF